MSGRGPTITVRWRNQDWHIRDLVPHARVGYRTLHYRLTQLGWPVDEALTRPPVRSRWDRRRK